MSLSPRSTVAALLAVVVVTTAGCSAATAKPAPAISKPAPTTVASKRMPPGVWKTAGQATQEYQQAEQALTLAPGWQWRTVPESATGPDGRPQFYQLGAATNDAQLYWFCSWVTQVAADKPDSTEARTAATELAEVRALYLYQQGLNADSRAVFDQLLTGLDQGNLDTVRVFVRQNCAGPA
ncbi:MAG TPA: hypothetical protein VHZ97_09240 [Pseudonocardiaceae bacterium]|nr:hypothetical protein [Pseudonocardiaceae bacterium]